MDEDVDMDAPQISTLREEATPPPAQPKTNPRRIKLVVKEQEKATPASSARHTQAHRGEDDEEDDEDQEDQLIDDETPIPRSKLSHPPRPYNAAVLSSEIGAGTSAGAAGASAAGSSVSAAASKKTKTPVKRKPRKHEKKPPEEGRLREKVMQQPGAPNVAPTMLWFEANPAASGHAPNQLVHKFHHQPESPAIADPGGQMAVLIPEPMLQPGGGKKKGSTVAKKQTTAKKEKAKEASTSKPKIKLLPPMPEDSGILSEGMTGTAASSPVLTHFDDMDYQHTPEPEQDFSGILPLSSIPIQNAFPASSPANNTNNPTPDPEDTPSLPISLEGIPVPIYPLPTKPFPVLPPPKISTTGFASNPPIAIDKSGGSDNASAAISKAKVRKWRTARREIRGIGGGRWFAKAWVGGKESSFARAMENFAAEVGGKKGGGGEGSASVAPSKSGNTQAGSGTGSASAPVKGSKGKSKASAAAVAAAAAALSSLATSAAPSRSQSQAPEGPVAGSSGTGASVRAPTKMRISQVPTQVSTPTGPLSEAGDSDMVL
ncbi:hypothetical protein D9757_007913 [Collybiopsis confluens]|uniref:Uncharacterized protein n=1 Tax=Collybiopsis confluens TaxID=2823264 RepID=A0A8H5HC40_9AGAR|nr:hypothetical protein D9757_007913 [Collybiopsis confluens]